MSDNNTVNATGIEAEQEQTQVQDSTPKPEVNTETTDTKTTEEATDEKEGGKEESLTIKESANENENENENANANANANENGQGQNDIKPEVVISTEQLKEEFQQRAKTYLAEQSNHVIIPSFSQWFDINTIHPLEKKSFPDFFTEETVYKNPQSYKYIRDFLVNTFRLNPKEYLTITSVRRNLAGDVTNIIRVHQFLEKWGLINYQIDPKTKASLVGPQYTGHFQITLDAPDGLKPYIPEDAKVINSEKVKSEVQPTPATENGSQQQSNEAKREQDSPLAGSSQSEASTAPVQFNLEVRRNVYATGEKKLDFKSNNMVQYACSICGKDATEVRYHNLKIKSYTYNPSSTINNASILCSICYEQGLFPLNFTSSDFVEFKKLQSSEEWTEQEVLLLLEGIEMFGTNEPISAAGASINVDVNNQWSKISEHVGTKSREQCLKKFLQLPIEDKYLTKLIKQEPSDVLNDYDVAQTEDNSSNNNNNNNNSTSSGGGNSKSNLVGNIVKKLLETNEGKSFIEQNAEENKIDSLLEQTGLINQIIELTVEKVNLKLARVDQLQADLLAVQNQLNKERKENLLNRWAQYEKIRKLKQARPDLADVLSDLLQPVKISESGDQNVYSNNGESLDDMEIDTATHSPSTAAAAAAAASSSETVPGGTTTTSDNTIQNRINNLPLSFTKPKEYQFWSG